MAIGTTGTPASMAAAKVAVLNGRTWSSRERVPSGKETTLHPSRSRAVAAPTLRADSCRWPRSMNTIPMAAM